jgi:hypothetical protein
MSKLARTRKRQPEVGFSAHPGALLIVKSLLWLLDRRLLFFGTKPRPRRKHDCIMGGIQELENHDRAIKSLYLSLCSSDELDNYQIDHNPVKPLHGNALLES